MKKMRKLSVWLVVAMMVLSLAGCAKEKKPTAEEVYAAAYEKINALTDLDAEMDMKIAMSAEGETMEMGIAADLLMENPGSEDMIMDMMMEMDMLGMNMEIQAYYVDGYYLMEVLGQKIKYKMPLEEAMGQASMAQEVAIEALSEINMVEEGEMRILTFTVDPAKMSDDYMDGYLSNMGLTDAEGSPSLEYRSMTGTMKVNQEGYPVLIQMEMSFTMEMLGNAIDCKANVEAAYNNPGQDVTVEIPDASGYMEVDPETMN